MIRKLWKRKWVKTAVVMVAAFVVANAVTYFWYAESVMPRDGVRHVTDYALLDDCDYVVLEPRMWSRLSESQKAALFGELSRPGRAVYYSLEEVPESALHYRWPTDEEKGRPEAPSKDDSLGPDSAVGKSAHPEPARRLSGLKGGVLLDWRLEGRGPFWMKCQASLWVSETGAEARSDVYLWLLGWWVPIYNVYRVEA